MKINWREKLSSRKFWCAVSAVVIAVAGALGLPEATAAQTVKIVTAAVSLIAYIFVQGNDLYNIRYIRYSFKRVVLFFIYDIRERFKRTSRKVCGVIDVDLRFGIYII